MQTLRDELMNYMNNDGLLSQLSVFVDSVEEGNIQKNVIELNKNSELVAE